MTRRRKSILVISLLTLAVVAAAVLTLIILPKPKPVSDIVEVPLGVEGAVIIATRDGRIEPAPFAWGVAVNVRIAEARKTDTGWVYDLRYIVNRAGDYDIKDYLRFTDAQPASSLPSFKVRGLERLTKDIETRIAETEAAGVGLRAWYYETLVILAAVWVLWFFLLVFMHRRSRPPEIVAMAGPTLADQIRALLTQFESGALDPRRQAEMEMMIFRHWRDVRGWDGKVMAESLAAFRADPHVASAFADLESWMHRRERLTTPADVARNVRANLEDDRVPPAPNSEEP